jgi:hypothetical protein
MSLCLAAGAAGAVLAVNGFTLAWMHSIEKIRWEEDWRIVGHELVIDEARIRGTGAGMEPPTSARLSNGVWHYRPATAPHAVLRLTHSPHTAGYELCVDGRCRPLAEHLPGIENNAVIELRKCPP